MPQLLPSLVVCPNRSILQLSAVLEHMPLNVARHSLLANRFVRACEGLPLGHVLATLRVMAAYNDQLEASTLVALRRTHNEYEQWQCIAPPAIHAG